MVEVSSPSHAMFLHRCEQLALSCFFKDPNPDPLLLPNHGSGTLHVSSILPLAFPTGGLLLRM